MAESTRYHRVVLTMRSPWNLAGATSHDWSVKFSLSGATALSDADADATFLSLWNPIKRLTSPNTSLIRASYYKSGETVAHRTTTYTAGAHAGDASAYVTSATKQQLEVCTLCRCPVGRSVKGRQVYLRKWVHDTRANPGDQNTSGATLNPVSITLAEWMTGAGPLNLVPIDPTDGTQGGPWQIELHLFTHQLRRGLKRRLGGASTNNVDIPPIDPIPLQKAG